MRETRIAMGKITKSSGLMIKRKGKLDFVACPFSPESGYHCGHWCALFGEPEPMIEYDGKRKVFKKKLDLCHKTIIFDELIDERE